jgi:hypothetical protein
MCLINERILERTTLKYRTGCRRQRFYINLDASEALKRRYKPKLMYQALIFL